MRIDPHQHGDKRKSHQFCHQGALVNPSFFDALHVTQRVGKSPVQYRIDWWRLSKCSPPEKVKQLPLGYWGWVPILLLI